MAYEDVKVWSGSGPAWTRTDANGEFRLDVGGPAIEYLYVGGETLIEWPGLGLSTVRGIRFTVHVKERSRD